MNTQKATYWVALALAAVAFHSEYQRGAFPIVHRAANSAGVTLCRMATKAERTVAMAKLIAVRPTVPDDDLLAAAEARQLADAWRLPEDQREMIREQVRAQAEIIRVQVLEQRGQLEKMRSLARQQVRLRDVATRTMVIDCPRARAKVKIHTGANLSFPNPPDPNFDIPDLEISDSD